MVDVTPAGITPGTAVRGSVVHASQSDIGNLSRSHAEEDISRLQSAVNDYDPTLTYSVGDIVRSPTLNPFSVRNIVAIAVPEAYDPDKWELITPGIFVMGLDTDKKGNTANRFAGMFTSKADFPTELPSQMFLGFPWKLVNVSLHIGLNGVGVGGTDFVFRRNGIDVAATLINVPGGVLGSFALLGIQESFIAGDLFNVRWQQIGGAGDVDNWSWNCEAITQG
jgi:hypothetical protein